MWYVKSLCHKRINAEHRAGMTHRQMYTCYGQRAVQPSMASINQWADSQDPRRTDDEVVGFVMATPWRGSQLRESRVTILRPTRV
jgi:hypothetical protein